jgi:Flp pilus assembly protein TadG
MKLLLKLTSFQKCRSGNVAMMFAAAIFPVVGTIGLAVDFSRAAEVKAQLTAAVDSTALSLAHASVNLTDAELQTKALALFNGNFKPGTKTDSRAVHASRATAALTVEGSAAFQTRFMRVLNVKTLDVKAKSKVVWGSKQKIEVVMALDNTGSMSGTKLQELKKAAKELVDTLEKSQGAPGSVKIGLVPFASTVRVDPKQNAYKNANWIRRDDVPYVEQECTKKKVDGVWHEECHDVSKTRAFNKNAWQGCIQDRDQLDNFDVTDKAFSSSKKNTLYPAIETCPGAGGAQDESKLQLVEPLTTDFNKLRTSIANMQAAGSTNVTIGIVWGMSLLSKQKPFDQGSSVTTGANAVKKYLIVLTDGENTKNRVTTNTAAIDARTKLACQAARDMGTVFSIRMIEGDATLLKACASDPENYHDVQAAADLSVAFRAIGNEIGQLRVAQ